MDKYLEIKEIFESREDKENAIAMSKYMRNMFDFYGLPTPKRKEEDSHREFQYLVYDYLLAMKQYVSYDDIPKIKEYIVNKSWWDTIDFLCKVIGDIELRDLRVKDLMLEWSKDDNIWIKRTAIEHQLNLKEKTDYELLEKIIINCFGTDEFFINKAIGWALREYSKTNSTWVKEFINRYKNQMSDLSIKEASKYI